MVLPTQLRLTSPFAAQQRATVTPAPSALLRFGSTDSTSGDGGDVFFRQNDDGIVRRTLAASPIQNTVAQPVAQLQQAQALAELLTVLDRRTGYLSGQQHGICPFKDKDGPIELTYPDGTVIVADLTVPPQLADTHVLHKDLRLAGGNSAWDRPYRYMAVPEAIVGKVPMHRSESGGRGFMMNDLTDLLHAQPETPSIVSFGNRPSVAITMEKPDGQMVRFTIDTNVKPKDRLPNPGDLPPVRIVNFSAVQMSMLDPDDPDPKDGKGILVKGLPEGARVVIRDMEMTPRDQQTLVANTLNGLYTHVPGAMLQGTKWPVTEDRQITPGNAKNEHAYTYPTFMDPLVFQYRYRMGHYAPEEQEA